MFKFEHSFSSSYLTHTTYCQNCNLIPIDSEDLETPCTYKHKLYTLHEALVPTDVATCTLVCMHEHADGIVKLMGVDGYPDEISFLRTDHDGSVFLEYL